MKRIRRILNLIRIYANVLSAAALLWVARKMEREPTYVDAPIEPPKFSDRLARRLAAGARADKELIHVMREVRCFICQSRIEAAMRHPQIREAFLCKCMAGHEFKITPANPRSN